MKTICPIHQSDYSGKTPPKNVQNIRICKKCLKKFEKKIKNEN
jgi:hypothetical protein